MHRDISQHIAELIERIGRVLNTDSNAEGLLPVQWEILRYLKRANRFSRSPAALTAYLGITKGTVSQSLATLEARGLVIKSIDPKDRRGRHLALTAQGKRLLQRDPLVDTVEAIKTLPGKDRESMAEGLQQVLSGRLDAHNRQPFGQCFECRHFAVEHDNGRPHYCMLLDEPLSAADSKSICLEQVSGSEELQSDGSKSL